MSLRPTFPKTLGTQIVQIRWILTALAIATIGLVISIGNLSNAFDQRSEVLTLRDNAFLVARPFQRLQREILNFSVIVAGGDEAYTVDELQLQQAIVASRYFDIHSTVNRNRLTPELTSILETTEADWDALQSDIDAYAEADMADETLRISLNSSLKELERAVNVFDNVHTIKIDQLDEDLAAQDARLTEAEIIVVVLLMLVVILSAAAIIRQLQLSGGEVRRTNQLLQAQTEQLDLINRELEHANRLKSEFLATMSHELRTPLNAILGYSGLLRLGIRGEVNQDGKEILSQIEGSGKHLLDLINAILDIAKIESGRMELATQPVNVRTLVDSWSSRLKVLADKKGIDFRTHVDQNLPQEVQGDQDRLTQIATNLISNAIKFTDEGQVNLEVGREHGIWFIQVTDTGKGIPPDAQEYIFDEFRQVDGSYTRATGGTGLGLSIVRKLAQAMGGNVYLQSKLGQGSTFSVKLPLVEVTKQPTAK